MTEQESSGTAQGLGEDFGRRFVQGVQRLLGENAEALGELDRRAGDGDFGTSVRTALSQLDRETEKEQPSTYRQWLSALYRGWLAVGGTSGPLFGVFFRELAKAGEADGTPQVEELVEALAAGQAIVQRYGEAEVGDKTMVDALAPAVEAMRRSLHDGEPSQHVLEAGEAAAVEGARSSAESLARRGRASYVGEASQGVVDPGAAAMALVLGAARAAADAGRGEQHRREVDTAWLV